MLREVCCRPVEYIDTAFFATLCRDCEKKYGRDHFRHYYAVDTLAKNLVREHMEEEHMNGFEKMMKETAEKYAEKYRKIVWDELNEKETPTMKVTYNGLTGELVKLELRTKVESGPGVNRYDLTLYDSEKQAAISFTGVKLDDVKFLGGAVTFGG